MDNIRCASSRFMYPLPQRKIRYADDGNALQVVGSRSLLPGTNQRIEDSSAIGSEVNLRIERWERIVSSVGLLCIMTGLSNWVGRQFCQNFSDGLSGIFKCLNNRIQQRIFGFQGRLVDHQAAGNISHMFHSFQTIGFQSIAAGNQIDNRIAQTDQKAQAPSSRTA